MVREVKFSWRGVLVIILLVIFGAFLVFGSFIYEDLKQVEENIYNLYQQVKTTNSKIDKFNVADEDAAKQAMKFTEATKNWQVYQNDELGFQLKSPASWGTLEFETPVGSKEYQSIGNRAVTALFSYFKNPPALVMNFIDYQTVAKDEKFADSTVKDIIANEPIGECSNELFEGLKKLNIGEIRNCFVKENILNQKFITYRHVRYDDKKQLVDEHLAVYARDKYYLAVQLPRELTDEFEYFIESIVFTN